LFKEKGIKLIVLLKKTSQINWERFSKEKNNKITSDKRFVGNDDDEDDDDDNKKENHFKNIENQSIFYFLD
jgi:hypothetical protein